MGWFSEDKKEPVKKKGFWDSLFEPERRTLDKKPMKSETWGHTLTPEQIEDLRLIQERKNTSWW